MKQNIIVEKLSNGVEIAVEEMPQLRSVTLGFWLKNGSRHETDEEAGLSHIVEHLVFKGSKTKSCKEIAEKIDLLGGNVDAFTSKETTSFVAKVLDTNFAEVMSLFSDMIFNPEFSSAEIELERDVILEEIKMIQDSPEDLVHELFIKAMYGSHPLGRSILGSPESVGGVTREKVLNFFSECYRPNRFLLAVAGNIKAEDVLEIAEKYLGDLEPDGNKRLVNPPEFKASINLVERRKMEQVQILLGVKAFGVLDKRRHILEVLNTYLGGSMSSRLFQHIREQLGLAYAINSFINYYSDTGFLAVHAATSPDRLEQLVEVIRLELESLARGEFSETGIERIKSLIKSEVVLGMEHSSSRMGLLAKHLLYLGEVRFLDDLLAEIDSVTGSEIGALAEELLDNAELTATAIGNLKDRTMDFSKLGG